MADGVIIYGPLLVIRRMNESAQEMLGYTAEIAARPFRERPWFTSMEAESGEMLPPEAHPPLRALHGETVRGIVLASRSPWPQALVLHQCRTDSPCEEEILGVVTTLAEVTSLRELQQRQQDFLHVVSHDLRTPLTVIHGHMQLLAAAIVDAGIDGEVRLSVEAIQRSEQRMTAMTSDLADIARLESRQHLPSLQPVDLTAYLPNLLQRLAGTLEVQRIALVDLPTTLPPVAADYNQLERILVNLLGNALKYSSRGTKVEIRVSRQEDSLVIAISDHGAGIPRTISRISSNASIAVKAKIKPRVSGLACTSPACSSKPTAATSTSTANPGRAALSPLPCRWHNKPYRERILLLRLRLLEKADAPGCFWSRSQAYGTAGQC